MCSHVFRYWVVHRGQPCVALCLGIGWSTEVQPCVALCLGIVWSTEVQPCVAMCLGIVWSTEVQPCVAMCLGIGWSTEVRGQPGVMCRCVFKQVNFFFVVWKNK